MYSVPLKMRLPCLAEDLEIWLCGDYDRSAPLAYYAISYNIVCREIIQIYHIDFQIIMSQLNMGFKACLNKVWTKFSVDSYVCNHGKRP